MKDKNFDISRIIHSLLTAILLIAPFYKLINKSPFRYYILFSLIFFVSFIINKIFRKIQNNITLKLNAISGIAEIISFRKTGVRSNRVPLVEFILKIKGDDGNNYKGKFHKNIDITNHENYKIGKKLKILFSNIIPIKVYSSKPIKDNVNPKISNNNLIKEKLEKLKSIYSSKLITNDEYIEKKKEILKEL